MILLPSTQELWKFKGKRVCVCVYVCVGGRERVRGYVTESIVKQIM